MALNPTLPASMISASYFSLIGGGGADYASDFADAYHAYSTAGVLSASGGGPGSEDKGIIQSFLASLRGNTTPAIFGAVLAQYWSTCLLIPNGTISVTNDALAKTPLFQAAVTATITQTEYQPFFQNLVANVQSMAVSQLLWTVVVPGPPPYTRVETVS